MSERPIPRATYRLQLHQGFRFADVGHLAPYLESLGVSHVYLSPILKARAGSTHGYDTVDHSQINPELGSLDEFRGMARILKEHGLGIILDIVPNHMGIGGSDNPYWLDVLEHGEASRYARWFDIDWHSVEASLDGKVLVPFLDRSYAEALAGGLLELRVDTAGKTAVWVPGGHKLPLAPGSYDDLDAARLAYLGSAAGRPALDSLIARQHWRVAKASVASDDINYRRFFIISDLAGIRIELPEVFEHVHQVVFELIGEGLVDGLRIDHVDGLLDPKAYCLELRQRAPRPIYIVVEKILAAGEKLPADWDMEGTTGYDFASLVTPLLVDPLGEATLTRFHREFTGVRDSPATIERQTKQRVMAHELGAELDTLSHRYAALARRHLATRDLSRGALKRGLEAFVAAMPVYRTYIDGTGPSDADRAVIEPVFASLRQTSSDRDDDALAFIERVLLDPASTGDAPAATELATRLQQFTSPVMAKGLEDTALYRYNRLLALNDVGERPDRFHLSIAAFHAANAERAASFPHAMLATSSHDSKRGEDARARIATLSGRADAWATAVPQWLELLRRQGAPEIAADDAYTFFQTLLGAWPGVGGTGLADRIVGAMQKSMREARLRSDWSKPDDACEAAVEALVRLALDNSRANPFLEAFLGFEAVIGREGAINGLIEATLKLTAPGVPDIYQGAELWEQSLVDPDNRRAVDFGTRAALLRQNETASPIDLLAGWRDGAVKQALIARLLRFRRSYPALFAAGSYEPVVRHGYEAAGICAFIRRHGETALFVAVRLYPWRSDTGLPEVDIGDLAGGTLLDVLSGAIPGRPVLAPEMPITVLAAVGTPIAHG